MAAVQQTIDQVRQIDVDQYKYGFETNIESVLAPKGLSEDIVRYISAKKNEPSWMLEWRLDAYRRWAESDEYPQSGWVSYLDGTDGSPIYRGRRRPQGVRCRAVAARAPDGPLGQSLRWDRRRRASHRPVGRGARTTHPLPGSRR